MCSHGRRTKAPLTDIGFHPSPALQRYSRRCDDYRQPAGMTLFSQYVCQTQISAQANIKPLQLTSPPPSSPPLLPPTLKMTKLGSLTVHVALNTLTSSAKLPEYDDPEEPSTPSKYIEALSDTPWRIFLRIPPHYVFKSEALVWEILVDGVLVADGRLDAPTSEEEGSPRLARRLIEKYLPENINDEMKHKLRFPLLLPNEGGFDIEPPEAECEAWGKREIVLRVFPGEIEEETWGIKATGEAIAFTFLPRPYSILRKKFGLPPKRPVIQPPPTQAPVAHSPAPEVQAPVAAQPAVTQPSVPHSSAIQTISSHPLDIEVNRRREENRNNPQLYCDCKRIIQAPVVACDNDLCKIRHFHLSCLGLVKQPAKWPWLCPYCEKLPDHEVECSGKVDVVDG